MITIVLVGRSLVMKINAAISVDKLKVCLMQPKETYMYLVNNASEDCIIGCKVLSNEGYRLIFVQEEEETITAVLMVADVGGEIKLGTFVFNGSRKYDGKCFFTYENAALYRHYLKLGDGVRHNMVDCLMPVIDDLGLKFNNITECEVALDTSVNYIKKLRSLIKDTENYDMYLNGKKVIENKTLDGYGEYFSRTRERLSRMPTLYFSQSKSTDLEMRVYDKARELKENSPQKKDIYEEWLGWRRTDKVYRVEVVLHNSNIRDFFERNRLQLQTEYSEHDAFLYMVGLPQFLYAVFCDSTDRLVYFRQKHTRDKISVIDFAGI